MGGSGFYLYNEEENGLIFADRKTRGVPFRRLNPEDGNWVPIEPSEDTAVLHTAPGCLHRVKKTLEGSTRVVLCLLPWSIPGKHENWIKEQRDAVKKECEKARDLIDAIKALEPDIK